MVVSVHFYWLVCFLAIVPIIAAADRDFGKDSLDESNKSSFDKRDSIEQDATVTDEQLQTVVERMLDNLDDADDSTTGSDSEGGDDVDKRDSNLEQNDNEGDSLDKNGPALAGNIITISWGATKVAIDTLRSERSAIDGKPIPIYREDLDDKRVAYWQIVSKSKLCFIVSAGPATGDYKLVFSGPVPSITDVLDKRAASYGKACSRYFMLTPKHEMMCKDEAGRIVATTIGESLPTGDRPDKSEDKNNEKADALLADHVSERNDAWANRANMVEKEGIWEDDTSELLAPGAFIELPVDEATTSIRLVYAPKSNLKTAGDVAAMKKKLCQLISLCDPASATKDIDISKPKQLFGHKYIELRLSDKAKAGLDGTPVDFGLRIASGVLILLKRFSLQSPVNRETRGVSTKIQYVKWQHSRPYSIKTDNLVPDYRNSNRNPFAVSLAMLFGFFDRRCHVLRYPGCDLYRSGPDGISGHSSAIAPRRKTSRLVRYVDKLSSVVSSKNSIIRFLAQRLPPTITRKLRVQTNFRSTTRFRRFAIARSLVRKNWPVIVMTKEAGKFRYAVMTKYRVSSQRYRVCKTYDKRSLRSQLDAQLLSSRPTRSARVTCGGWRIRRRYQMYIHPTSGKIRAKWSWTYTVYSISTVIY